MILKTGIGGSDTEEAFFLKKRNLYQEMLNEQESRSLESRGDFKRCHYQSSSGVVNFTSCQVYDQ